MGALLAEDSWRRVDFEHRRLINVDIDIAMSSRVKTLAQVAKEIGVSAITLRRWLLTKKVGEVGRDRNGWRIFSEEDVARLKNYANKVTPPKRK